MTWSEFGYLIGVLVALGGGLYAVFYGIPHCQLSMYRYKLWELRDELMHARHTGSLEDTEDLRELVRRVESAIRHLGRLTPFNMGIMWATGLYDELSRRAVHEPPPKEIEEQYKRLLSITRTYFRRGSPSGWAFAIVEPAVRWAARRSERASTTDTELTVTETIAQTIRKLRALDVAEDDLQPLHALVG